MSKTQFSVVLPAVHLQSLHHHLAIAWFLTQDVTGDIHIAFSLLLRMPGKLPLNMYAHTAPMSLDVLVKNLPRHPQSATYASRLWSGAGGNFNQSFVDYTYPVYYADAATGNYTVNGGNVTINGKQHALESCTGQRPGAPMHKSSSWTRLPGGSGTCGR